MELPDVVMPPPEVPEPSPDLAPPDHDDKKYEKDGDTSVNELEPATESRLNRASTHSEGNY